MNCVYTYDIFAVVVDEVLHFSRSNTWEFDSSDVSG